MKAFIFTMDAIMALVLFSSLVSVFEVPNGWTPSPLYNQLSSVADVYERVGGDPLAYMDLLGIKGGYILYDGDGPVAQDGDLNCEGPWITKTVHRDGRWYMLKMKGCAD